MVALFLIIFGFFLIGCAFGGWLGFEYAAKVFGGIMKEQRLTFDERGRITIDYPIDNNSLAE